MLNTHFTRSAPGRVTILIFAAVLGLAPLAAAQDQNEAKTYDLRPVWQAGQTSHYRITQTEVTEQQFQGVNKTLSSTLQLNAEASWHIEKVSPDGSGGTATLTLDKISMTITDPTGHSVTEDGHSSNEATESLRTWIDAMTGSPLTVDINANGEIERVSGYQAIQSKAGDAGKKLDEQYFKEIAMDTATLSGGPGQAKIGAQWDEQYDGSHRMGEIHYTTTYHLASVEPIAGIPIALVNRTSKLKFTPDFSDLPADAPKLDVRTTEATQSGQVMFDMSRHEVVGSTNDQVLGLQISFTIAGHDVVRTSREITHTEILRISEQ